MTKPLCIYHGNCADGFTAAWAVWKRLGEGVEFHAGFYGAPPPNVAGRDVMLVDFSYKRDVLEAMAHSAASILILDHHKTAEADLAGYPAPCAGWATHLEETAVEADRATGACTPRVLFDMDRSGAGIAWDFFHPDTARPSLVDYVEDRDLWRFDLNGSREVAAYVFAHAYNFKTWDSMAGHLETDRPAAIGEGAAIERKHHKDIAELAAKGTRRMTLAGHDVPVLNVPYTLSSDAGHLLAQGEAFAACYWDSATHRVFSLRSAEEGADVSEIARRYGGGGHRHAAGFQIPIDEVDAWNHAGAADAAAVQ